MTSSRTSASLGHPDRAGHRRRGRPRVVIGAVEVARRRTRVRSTVMSPAPAAVDRRAPGRRTPAGSVRSPMPPWMFRQRHASRRRARARERTTPRAIRPPRAVRPPLKAAATSPRPTTSRAVPRKARGPTSQLLNRVIRGERPDDDEQQGDGDARYRRPRAGRGLHPRLSGRSVRRRPVAGRAGRHEQPQEQVDDDAGAAGECEGDEADAPQERVDAAVLGQPTADAAEDLVGAAAAQLRADGRLGWRWRAAARPAGRAAAGRGAALRGAERLSWREACRSGRRESIRERPHRDPGSSSRVITGVGRVERGATIDSVTTSATGAPPRGTAARPPLVRPRSGRLLAGVRGRHRVAPAPGPADRAGRVRRPRHVRNRHRHLRAAVADDARRAPGEEPVPGTVQLGCRHRPPPADHPRRPRPRRLGGDQPGRADRRRSRAAADPGRAGSRRGVAAARHRPHPRRPRRALGPGRGRRAGRRRRGAAAGHDRSAGRRAQRLRRHAGHPRRRRAGDRADLAAAAGLPGRGARRPDPLGGAGRRRRPPARLGAADPGAHPAARRRPAGGQPAGPQPGAGAARLALRPRRRARGRHVGRAGRRDGRPRSRPTTR